jgi:hypothetical protein
MLSEEEKQEMRELAASKAVREEFRLLRKYSAQHQPVNLDRFIRFLTVMARLNSKPGQRRPFVEYTRVRL